jgi:hypothetical protein
MSVNKKIIINLTSVEGGKKRGARKVGRQGLPGEAIGNFDAPAFHSIGTRFINLGKIMFSLISESRVPVQPQVIIHGFPSKTRDINGS